MGFRVIDHIARQNDVAVKKKQSDSLIGEWRNGREKVLLVKPQTYMNRSGLAVKTLLGEYGASAEDLVVVYDELDLPFGRIRIRPKGGAGGHGGMLSLLENLAGAPFCRVRIGIGRPLSGMDPADFVLEPFNSQEVAELGGIVERASAAVVTLLQDGVERAMAQFNRVN